MCGIAAELLLVGQPSPENAAFVGAMHEAQAHRGPDGTTIIQHGVATVAFDRLALVDRYHGDQPFWSHDGEVVVVVNGEIYNHEEIRHELPGAGWVSGSDCEAVLRLYEDDPTSVPSRLEGMYAAIIFDRRRGVLTAFTDRFGIKPLFWKRLRDRILLASEIKALQAHPLAEVTIDWPTALVDPQLLGEMALYDRLPTSFYAGVELVPAATEVVFDVRSGSMAHRCYWTPPNTAEANWPAHLAVARYAEALEESVRRCTIQSEREVGVFLSGGVDSGIIAAIAAVYRQIRTYSLRTFSTVANGDADRAILTARSLGVAHQQLDLDAAGPWTPEQYLRVLYICETPLTGPEQLFKYELHRAIRADNDDVRVLLTGQGSDEFNGGYSSLLAPPGTGWPGFMGTLQILAELVQLQPVYQKWRDTVGPVLSLDGLRRYLGTASEGVLWDRYVRMKYCDLQMFNNWHEDRTSAAHGSETRVPFLDRAVVESALSLDPRERAVQFWDKTLLRTIASRWLPDVVAKAKKVPMFYGVGEQHARNIVLDVMLAQDGELVRMAFDGHDTPIDAKAIIEKMQLARRSPGTNVNWVLLTRLVNLGLLDALARGRLEVPAEVERPLVLRSYVSSK